jgi:hypothetical protein
MTTRHKIEFLPYNKCKRVGLDEPVATVMEVQEDYMLIKIPGHSYWSGRGMQSYASPEMVVLQRRENGWWYEVLSHDCKRKEKP